MYQNAPAAAHTFVRRHLETFSRHKLILILPVVIALLVSSWQAMSRPHSYESAMTVWFDTAAPNPSSLFTAAGNLTPAAQGQQILAEFLGTEQFLMKVGHRGPLASELATKYSGPTLDAWIVATLGHAFSVTVDGPQVATITMTAGNPAYIPGTLTAVADEYVSEVTGSLKSREQASVAYYQTQVNAAKQTLSNANNAVQAYQQSHPNVSPANDAAFNQLTREDVQAQDDYSTLQNTLQQTQLALQNVTAPTAFHVIDPPAAPVMLTSKKHMIFTVVAGLAAGLIISVLGLSALTRLDTSARRREDIEESLDLEVVGTIGEMQPRLRGITALRRSSLS